jgi:hypothetical protein
MRLVRTGRSLALAVVAIAGGAFAVTAWSADAVQIQTGRSTFETRPAGVVYTANLSREAIHLHWTSWGGARALATGIDLSNPCRPTCELDHARGHAAHFVFSDVRRCRSHRIYTRIRVVTAPWARAYGGTWKLPLLGCR